MYCFAAEASAVQYSWPRSHDLMHVSSYSFLAIFLGIALVFPLAPLLLAIAGPDGEYPRRVRTTGSLVRSAMVSMSLGHCSWPKAPSRSEPIPQCFALPASWQMWSR